MVWAPKVVKVMELSLTRHIFNYVTICYKSSSINGLDFCDEIKKCSTSGCVHQ